MPKTMTKLDKGWYFLLPASWFMRLREIWRGKHDTMAEGLRHLIKLEILRHGPLPRSVASVPKPVSSAPPARPAPSDAPEPPQAE